MTTPWESEYRGQCQYIVEHTTLQPSQVRVYSEEELGQTLRRFGESSPLQLYD